MRKAIALLLTLTMAATLFMAMPMMTEAASMADATFFAKFNYAAFPGLADVKAAVDKNDFTAAKAALLQYYRDRKAEGTVSAFPITEDDANLGMANLALDNILPGPYEFDVWLATMAVAGVGETAAEWVEADLTDKVAAELDNRNISVMLFERQKQQFPILVHSKESAYAPELVIETVEGNTYTIYPNNDTYVSSGATGTAYGSEATLYVKEQSDSADSAFGTQTRRAYLNFPLDQAANQTVSSATLRVHAYLSSDCTTGAKEMHVLSVGDTRWTESTLTWSGINGNVYSWQDTDTPPWTTPSGADSEYTNVTARFWYAKAMVWEYQKYLADPTGYPEGEQYGEKLLQLMDAFATKKSYGFNRTLETGERQNRWTDILHAMVDTPAMTPDIFCNLVSFVWGDCNNILSKAHSDLGWSNWKLVANSGVFKAVEFFPEFTNYSTWRAKSESNAETDINELYNSDMSFTESGLSYSRWCASLLGDVARMADLNGNPVSTTFTERLRYIARNAAEGFYPNGYDTNIGDSNFCDQMSTFRILGEFLNDPVLLAYTSGGVEGDAPYLTSYYADAQTAYMRNSWNPDEAVYVNFMNSRSDGHAHRDSNQVLFYAYGQPLLVDSGRYGYSGNAISTQLKEYASHHNTIEKVGATMAAHSTAGKNFNTWASNDSFDFASSTQVGYGSANPHTRNVLFLRNEDFAIVSDYITGTSSATYRQNWHFLPSNNASINGQNVMTNFYQKANLTISVASTDSVAIRDGYHSANYGLVAESQYASYEKMGSTVKFDTVLYPSKQTAQPVATTDLSPNDASKSNMSVTVDGLTGYYYHKNTDAADGAFGDGFTTDADTAYVNHDFIALVGATRLAHDGAAVIESATEIPAIAITAENSILSIDGADLVASDDAAQAIAITAYGVTKVVLNGVEVPYTREGGVVYAVAVKGATGAGADVVVNDTLYNYVGENLLENGDFTNGMTGWTNASDGQTLGWTPVSNQTYTHGDGMAVTNSVSAGGNAATTMRTFVPIESGKQYYASYYAYNTGAQTANMDTAGMSSIVPVAGAPVFGTFAGLTFKDYVEYGGHNSWSAEPQSEVYRGRIDLANAPGMNHHEFIITAPENAPHLMISFGAWVDSGRLYWSDFVLREVEYVGTNQPSVSVTFTTEDGTELATPAETHAPLNSIFVYEDAPATLTDADGTLYMLSGTKSNLSVKVAASNNAIRAIYVPAASIVVSFVDEANEKLQADVLDTVLPGRLYSYSAPSILTVNGLVYTLNEALSTLSVTTVEGENVLTARYSASESIVVSEDISVRGDNVEEGVDTVGISKSISRLVVAENAATPRVSYLKMDLSGITANRLQSAQLMLTIAETANGTSTVTAYQTTNDWSETDVPQYANLPAKGAAIASTDVALNQTGTVTLDLTNYIKLRMIEGATEASVRLDDLGATNNNIVHFYSKDSTEAGAAAPVLLLTYSAAVVEEPSLVTVNYLSDGEAILPSTNFLLNFGETLEERHVVHEEMVDGEGSIVYCCDGIEGLGAVADGKPISVNVIYKPYNATTQTITSTRGATIQVNNNGANHTNAAGYADRLMADSRSNTSSGTLYGLAGFDLPDLSGKTIGKAEFVVYTGSGNNQTTSTSYAVYSLEDLGGEWTRSTVTGVGIPAGASPTTSTTIPSALGAGVREAVSFDLSSYLSEKTALSDLSLLIVSTGGEGYGVFYSENTAYPAELRITVLEEIQPEGVFVTIENGAATVNANPAIPMALIVAQYGENGELLKVQSASAEEAAASLSITIEAEADATNTKAFVWNSLDGMIPLAMTE